MIANFFRKNPANSTPQQIYGGLMTQARDPGFYAKIGIPDTVMGRFDMLAMHVYFITRRLRQESSPIAESLGQDIFDLFVEDVERALRELGIGDTTVPKRKRKLVHSFYAQIDEFDPAMDNDDLEILSAKVKARYFADTEGEYAVDLSNYMMKSAKHLDSIPFEDFMKGRVTWLAV